MHSSFPLLLLLSFFKIHCSSLPSTSTVSDPIAVCIAVVAAVVAVAVLVDVCQL